MAEQDAGRDPSTESTRPPEGTRPRGLRIRRALGFLVALGLTVLLAADGGGYDVVIRHQVGLAIWALIALGLAAGVLPRSQLRPAAWVSLCGFAGLACLMLLSLAWTESDERTTEELARIIEYAGVVVLILLSLNRYTWRGAAYGFVAGALLVPFLALGARFFPDLFTDQVARVLQTDRLSYPLDYWNGVACWGAMATAIGLSIGANAARVWIRCACLAAVPAAALTVYLTYSRFGVAAMAIAVLAAVALSRHRWTATANSLVAATGSAIVVLAARSEDQIANGSGTAGRGTVILLLIAASITCGAAGWITKRAGLDRTKMDRRSARFSLGAAAVAAVVAAIALHQPLGDAWDEFKNDKPPAANGSERLSSLGSTRYQVWTTALDAFEADPMRGVGAGSFEFYWSMHGEGPEFIRDAHSLYFETLAELGVPGAIALLAALGGLLWAAIQARAQWLRRREIAVGGAVISAFVVFLAYAGVDWMWELGAVGTLAIGGISAAAAGGFERAGSRRMGPWVRSLAVAAAVAAAISQVPGLVSVERLRASANALRDGDSAEARDLADQAINAESWAAAPYAMRALAYEAAGNLSQARRDIDEAIEREPDNWRHRLLAARIDAATGDGRGMRAQLGKARRDAPDSLFLVRGSPYLESLKKLLSGAQPEGTS